MTGIAHVSTGLLLKARFRKVPLLWLLLAAEVADLLWVALNLLHSEGGEPVELARVADPLRSFADLQIIHQPYSHSLLMSLGIGALLAWLAYVALRTRAAAIAVFCAAAGHWLLDFMVHDADLPLWPSEGAPVAGPALNFDSAMPTLGLNSTWPLAGWGAQTFLVLIAARAFSRAFPTTRKKTWLFYGAMAVLCAVPAPLFLEGVRFPLSGTNAFVLATLMEISVTVGAVWWVTRRTHRQVRETYPAYDRELTERLRGAKRAIGVMCFFVGAAYLLQTMLDGGGAPAIARYSLVLAGLYVWIGTGVYGWNLGDLWLAIWLPLLWGPVARSVWGAGAVTPLVAGLEVLLAVLAIATVYRIRTNRVLL